MDIQEPLGTPEPITVTYTLTRLQRVLNPPERLLFAFVGLAGLALGGLVAIASVVQGFWLGISLGILIAPGAWLIFRNPVRSLYASVFDSEYINRLTVYAEWIDLGWSGGAVRIPKGLLTVSRGVLGTCVLRDKPRGYSVTVASVAVTTDELRRL